MIRIGQLRLAARASSALASLALTSWARARAALRLLLLLLAVGWAAPLPAQEVVTPPPGSDERRHVLDAARPVVAADLGGQPLVFVVHTLRIVDGWALLEAQPQQPGGRPIDYRATAFAEAVAAGVFDDWVAVLLRQQNGSWQVVTHVIGATDYPPAAWARAFPAPAALFR